MADQLTMATNVPGVFAGGDVVTGPWIAIGAVAAGREAAVSIDRFFKGEDLAAGREKMKLLPEDEQSYNPIPAGIQQTPAGPHGLPRGRCAQEGLQRSSSWAYRPSRWRPRASAASTAASAASATSAWKSARPRPRITASSPRT